MEFELFKGWIKQNDVLHAEFKVHAVSEGPRDAGAIISRAVLSLQQVVDYLGSEVISPNSKTHLQTAMDARPA